MDTGARKTLLQEIHRKICKVNEFATKKERLGNRLIIASFICTGFTSILTGGKAGGLWPQAGELGQAVVILAAVCAFAATVMTGIYKQLVIPSRLVDAQTGKTDLQNLELEVTNGADLAEATKKFKEIRKNLFFIPDDLAENLAQVTGEIKEAVAVPPNPDIFACSGVVKNMSDGLHLWLAVMNEGGRGWPKDSDFDYSPCADSPCDGSWEQQIKAAGGSEKFTLALLVTNGQANHEIHEWINRCNRKSSYPAFLWPRKGGIKVLSYYVTSRGTQPVSPGWAATDELHHTAGSSPAAPLGRLRG